MALARRRRWLRLLLGTSAVVLVFAAATLGGLVLHLDLPAPRRAAAVLVSGALSDLFAGQLHVEGFDQLSPTNLVARNVSVHDPEGNLVLTVEVVRGRYAATRILREYLFGEDAFQVYIDHARADGARAWLIPGPDDVPTIFGAFEVIDEPGEPSDSPAGRRVTIALPIIEVGDLAVRGDFAEAPTLHAKVRRARGSLLVTPESTALDFEPFGLRASGFRDWQASGLGSVHVRDPGPIWANFDGQLGDVPVHLFGRIDGNHVDARVELPEIQPDAARALVPAWPVENRVAARATATGRLPELTAQVTAQVGDGTVSANGSLMLEDGVTADIDLDMKSVDLAWIDPALPSTAIESRGAVLVWSDGAQISAELNGTIEPSEVGGVAVPAVDLRATYDGEDIEVAATLHERGVPAHLDMKVSPDGAVAFRAHVGRTRLENSPRLTAWLGARGTVEAELEGTLQDGVLDSRLELRSSQLRYKELGLGSAYLSATARGPLREPSALQLSSRMRSSDARLGDLRLARLEAESTGRLDRQSLSVRAEHPDGTELEARTEFEPSPLSLRDAQISIARDGVGTSARLRRVRFQGAEIKLEGLRVDSGGFIEGDVSWGPGRYMIDARGEDLDLGRIAEALSVPRNLLGGKLSLDGRLRLGESSSGQLAMNLENASFWLVSGVDLKGKVQFDGRRSQGELSGAVSGLGEFNANWDGTLAGDPVRPESWLDATGQAQLRVERVNLAAAHHAVRSPVLVGAGGQGYAGVSVARTQPGQLPQALFLLGTQGLSLELRGDEGQPPHAIDSVDISMAGAVEGSTGKLAATGRIFDPRSDLMTLSAELDTDLDAVASALLRGESPWPLVAERPLRAVVIIPYRDFAHLPSMLRPSGYTGRGSARAVVAGTLSAPELNFNVAANQLTGSNSPFIVPMNGEATFRYALATGKLQGSVRATQDRIPLARGTFDLVLPWQHLRQAPAGDTPAWTGNTQLVLDGVPLELLRALSERRVRGSVQGSVVVSRRDWVPHVRADLALQELEVGGASLGEGRLIADTSEDAVLVRAHFDDELGSLTASARAGVSATSAALSFAEESPLRFTLESRQYDARVLSPLVRDIFPELSGTMNGTVQAIFEPPERTDTDGAEVPWQAHLSGKMTLAGGVVEPRALGLRLEDTSLTFVARPEGEYNIISLDDIRARAGSDRQNLEASGKIYLRNLDIEHARFEVKQDSVPISAGGARVADLTGTAHAVVERQDEEMAMTVEVPRMTAELPAQIERPLIELEDNPSIEVLQTTGPPQDEEEEDGQGPATPWRIRFRLGDQVRVQSRLLNLQLRGGPEVYLAEETHVGGTIELVPGGRVTVLGRTFVIDQGRIIFDTDEPGNPHLDVTATWRAPNGVLVMANVQGTAQEPTLSWNSDPGLPGGEAEVIALVLGASGGESRDSSSAVAGALVNEVLGQAAPHNVQLSVSRDTGTGEGQVARMSERTWDAVTATFQISDQVWLEGSYLRPHDTAGAVNAQDPGFAGAIDWRFHPDWSLRTEAGNLGTGVDLLWRYRY